jgi:hypothetical protein
MAGVTDIPDWTANEVGLEYGWLNAGPAAYQTMWDRSPIAHVDNVTAPVFLMIGECGAVFCRLYQCCGSGSESGSVGSLCF